MAYGCFADALRFFVVALGALCLALWLGTLWLGPEHRTILSVDITQSEQIEMNIAGPAPDLEIDLVRRHLMLHTSNPLGRVVLHAQPLGLTTIALCALMVLVDRGDRRQRWRS